MGVHDYIASVTATGTTFSPSVEFNSIPQTYQDLYFVCTGLNRPANTGGTCKMEIDNGGGGWLTSNFSGMTRADFNTSGVTMTHGNTANEWVVHQLGGASSTQDGAWYFEFTLQNYTTATTDIGGFFHAGYNSMDGSVQDQSYGGQQVWDSYTGSGAGIVSGVRFVFDSTYLQSGTNITLYGIGS